MQNPNLKVSLFLLLLGCFFVSAISGCVPVREILPHSGPTSIEDGTASNLEVDGTRLILPLPQKQSQLEPYESEFGQVEVVFEVPKEPVDAFHIEWGYGPNDLTSKIRAIPTELQIGKEKGFGELYRFLIRNVLLSETVFVRIAAERSGVKSRFSQVFAVAPQADMRSEPNSDPVPSPAQHQSSFEGRESEVSI